MSSTVIVILAIWLIYIFIQRMVVLNDLLAPSTELTNQANELKMIPISKYDQQNIYWVSKIFALIFTSDFFLFNVSKYLSLWFMVFPNEFLVIIILIKSASFIFLYLWVRGILLTKERRKKLIIESRIFRFINNILRTRKWIMILIFLVHIPYSTKVILLLVICSSLWEYFVITFLSNLLLIPLFLSMMDERNSIFKDVKNSEIIQNSYSHISFAITWAFLVYLVVQLRDPSNFEYKGRKIHDDWTNYFHEE